MLPPKPGNFERLNVAAMITSITTSVIAPRRISWDSV